MNESAPPSAARCVRHPDTPGPYVCALCGSANCIRCCNTMFNGEIWCVDCRDKPAPVVTPPPLPPGAGCIQHPTVAPVAHCKLCGAGSCSVCDFYFPSGNRFRFEVKKEKSP